MAEDRNHAVTTMEGGGASPAPVPDRRVRGYRRRLANLDNVRCALADVVRRLETSEMDPKLARAMVYALSTLAGIMVQQAAQSVPTTGASLPRGAVLPRGGFRLELEVVREQPEPDALDALDAEPMLELPPLENHEPSDGEQRPATDEQPAPAMATEPKQPPRERRISRFRCNACDGLNGFAVGTRAHCGDCGESVPVP